ncbi:MAG TPA: SMC family ATPase [Polyangiaceae bacterium]|nr:SMC family ATPase [Polyangiaceae bacterium]
MRLTGIHLHAIKPYPTDVRINFDEIPGQIIALVGENGAGKTRLVESWPGSMYRKAPTHGALAPWAAARDSFIETSFVNGAPWTVRQSIDAISGKGEAQLLDGNGQAVLESTKVREFDAWAAGHLPAPEVFLNSLFSAQGTNGLLGLPSAERKAVVLRALGVEDLEAKAERARKQKAAVEAQLATQKARIDDELARGGNLEELQGKIVEHEAAVTAADQALQVARANLDNVKAAVEEYDRQVIARHEAAKRRQELHALLDNAKARKADVEKRLANNRAVLGEADAIRAAEAKGRGLEQEITKLDAQLAGLETSIEDLRRQGRELEPDIQRAAQRKLGAERQLQATQALLADREAVEQAQADLERLTTAAQMAKQAVEDIDAKLEALRGQHVAGAEERIVGLRVALGEVLDAKGLPFAVETARHALAADDAAETTERERPATMQAATEERRAAVQASRDADAALAKAQQTAHKHAQIAAAAEQLPEHEQAVTDAQAERDRLAAKKNELAGGHTRLMGQRLDATQQRDKHAADLEAIKPLRAKVQPLDSAEARIAELEPQVAQLDAEIARIETDLGTASVDTPPPSDPPALGPAKSAVEASEKELSEARSALAVAQQRVTDAQASAAKVAELEAETAQLHTDLSDWQKLADDLGKKGIQALLIDAAGPEISTLTNELLSACFGTRYSVSFLTVRLSADGKKEIEDFEIRVLDTEQGRDADGSLFSGGQKVLINECLSMAFSVFNCRRHGVSRPTLIRDETGAALSEENGRRYINMLRRGAQIIGADKVLFVSHSRELVEMADSRIELTPTGVHIA